MNKINEKEDRKYHFFELINAPYNQKIAIAKKRIEEFILYVYDQVAKKIIPDMPIVVSFSGGKDSTVLFDLVCKTYQEMIDNHMLDKYFNDPYIYILPAYAYEVTFPDTILFIKEFVSQYKEKYNFVKDIYFSKPKNGWLDVLKNYGYPIFSKQISVIINRILNNKSPNGLSKWIFKCDTSRFHLSKNRLFLLDKKMRKFEYDKSLIDKDYFPFLDDTNYFYSEKCCNQIKGGLKHMKNPTFVGVMATESNLRKNSWINNGCNIMNENNKVSRPLSIFKSIDIWKYLVNNDIKINKNYGNINEIKTKLKDILSKDMNYTERIENDELIEEILNLNLDYKRLGCIACPYGSHIEQKKENTNRFEILYKKYPKLYDAQVIKNGMYKILIDMNIKIPGDLKYMKLYEERHKQIDKWYANFEENFIDTITQIENYKNWKGYNTNIKKYTNSIWIYDNDTLEKIFNNYGMDLNNKIKYFELIKKFREKRLSERCKKYE